MSVGAFLLAAGLAALMGAAIQKGATCLVAAVHEAVHRRAAWRLLAMLEAGLIAAAVLATVRLIEGPVAFAPPPEAGWWTLAGGVLLGLGAWVARACVFGAIVRIGNGEIAFAGVPVGFFLGAWATVRLVGEPQHNAAAQPMPPESAALVTLLVAGLWLLWRLLAPRAGERLLSPRNATALIGLLFAILLLVAGPWAWTDAVSELAITGMDSTGAERLLLVVALFAGGVASGLALGHFRPQAPRAAELARTVAGGALMAAGSLLVPGSNDGLLLLGVPMLWPYALLALGVMGLAIAAAEWIATRAGRSVTRPVAPGHPGPATFARLRAPRPLLASLRTRGREPIMHDIVIRGGTIVDGSGNAPFVGDVAIDGGLITAVGTVAAKGREELDAAGLVVAPGFVDIHTHYDGQATWDPEMAPSAWHGVTTVVMGNCGVGFAPAHPERHQWLIELMEGVEDIPGTALAEGMSWDWESFPDYLSALEKLPRTVDVGTHVPHGAVRAYVMGERGARNEPPTETDIARMAAIVEEGLRAGALGFSTSRTILHKSKSGELVPGTTATREELIGIGRAMGRAGHGVFEMASDLRREWNEFQWMGDLSRETGLPITFAALESPAKELPLTEQLALMQAENDKGAHIVAQIALRATGILMAWQGTVHPFLFKPAWAEIAALPWEEKLQRLKDETFRARMIGEAPVYPQSDVAGLLMIVAEGWFLQYRMAEGFDYEPPRSESIAALAAASGRSGAEIAYDLLMEADGSGFIYLPLLNYADGDLDFLEPIILRTDTINSLSDGGAHCGTICDAASPTFLLQHWVRDRAKGRIPIELAIQRQCRDTALLYGLSDRGLLAPGHLADINLIDMARLKLGKPWLAFDLPAGGKRLLQKAEGYVATLKSGVVTFREGKPTGATPGRVVRGPQAAPLLARAAE